MIPDIQFRERGENRADSADSAGGMDPLPDNRLLAELSWGGTVRWRAAEARMVACSEARMVARAAQAG